ncbi:hypothetical protein ACHAXM_012157 [Skeletonema potamos]
MNDLDDKIAAKLAEKKKSKGKKKRRSSYDEEANIGQLKSPPELQISANQILSSIAAKPMPKSNSLSSLSSKGKSSKDSSSKGKSSKDSSSEHFDAFEMSVAKMPAAKMPGAHAAKSTDLSAAERLKFGTLTSAAKPLRKPGAFSATDEDFSAAERLKFGTASFGVKPATQPGAFSATDEDFSAAERLKFGIVSSVIAAQAAPGAYSMSNEDTTAAERLKFGIAHPVPVVSNGQVAPFDPTSEYSQSYGSNLTNDYWGTQRNPNENKDAVVEAEIVPDGDENSSEEFRWRGLFILSSVVSLAIIIGLSAALSSAKNTASSIPAIGQNTGGKQPTSYPSISPSLPPLDISWCFSNLEYVENFRYAAFRSALIASGQSTEAEFATDNSYQRKSLCWLAFGDGLQIDTADAFIEQRFSLATLFYSLNESSKLLSSGWLSDKQECAWTPMVECDLRTGSTVAKLNVSGFDLQGYLPKELSSLRYVTHLDMSTNLLDGGVEDATSGWNELQELRLANNRFGSVPEIMNALTSITYLDVSKNNISGEIPEFLSFMSNLVHLDISSNSINNAIPDYMGGNLLSLSALYMHSNNLTGKMPQSICSLRNFGLIHLSVDCGEGQEVYCDVPQCCTVCNGYGF